MPDSSHVRELQSAVFHMLGRNCELKEILQVLCNYFGTTQAERQIAFFLREHNSWELAASGDLTPESAAGLAAIQPDELTRAVFEPGFGALSTPRGEFRAKLLYSEIGELLGILVTLAEEQHASPQRVERVDFVGRLAVLCIEQRNMLDELLWRSDHDVLTGLFSRTYFERLIGWKLEGEARLSVALLCINLDRFRLVNEVLGQAIGNRVLEQVSRRLGATLGSDATLARTGGDEFAVLCAPEQAARIAEDLLDSLQQPIVVDGNELSIAASVGISSAAPGSCSEVLQREAYIALRCAKRGGKERWRQFDPSMAAVPPERLEMERRLRTALRNGEVSLHYQPQIHLASGMVCGVEALMRWTPAGIGSVAPATFVPILEETGLIGAFGSWVLHEACRQAATWRSKGVSLRVAVNVAAPQFADPDFPDEVVSALAEAGLPPRFLELELTESTFVGDYDHARRAFNALKAKGICIAIDDFGIGQSSLSYLHELAFERLKIDRQFVKDLGDGRDQHPLLENLIRLATDLGMVTIAEGIDRPDQIDLLRTMGCVEGQGFFFARPMPAEELLPALVARGYMVPREGLQPDYVDGTLVLN